MARRVRGFARQGASELVPEETGVMYRLGLNISELQERYDADSRIQTAEEMMRLYGRQGPHLSRPTSQHLQSPLLRDEHGIEYTPAEPGSTVYWYARISPAVSRTARTALAEGKTVQPNQIGGDIYPPPGSLVTLRRYRKHPINRRPLVGVDPEQLQSSNVRSLDTGKRTASTLIVFETPINGAQTEHEMELFEARARKHGVRLGTDRTY